MVHIKGFDWVVSNQWYFKFIIALKTWPAVLDPISNKKPSQPPIFLNVEGDNYYFIELLWKTLKNKQFGK